MSRADTRTAFFAVGLVAFQLILILAAVLAGPDNTGAMLVLLGGGALILAWAALITPAGMLLLAVLCIVLPLSFLTFFVFEWLLMAALAASALLHAVKRRTWPAPSAMELLWVLYVGWAVVTATHAADTYTALQGLSRILVAGMAFVAGYRILGDRWSRALVRVMSVLAFAVAVQLVGTILTHGFSMALITARASSVTNLGWGASNYVAAVASLAAACAITLLLFGTRHERVIGALGVLGALIVQVTTLSRGGAVALLVGLALAGLVEARRRLLAVVLVVSGVVAAYLFSPLGAATLARFTSTQGLASIGARLLFYREAWSIWRSHWIAGVGPDQIPYHTPIFIGANPHNIILKHLADLGVVGLALYVALFAIMISKAIRARLHARDREGLTLAIAMIVALGVGVANAQYEPTLEGNVYGFLFWLLMGSLSRQAERTCKADRSATA